MSTREQQQKLYSGLMVGTIVVGLAVVGLTAKVIEPLLHASPEQQDTKRKVQVPPYDYKAWHGLPVLYEGRIKPFATACEEVVRNVTGRARFEGQDPVAVVLQWKMLKGTGDDTSSLNWETYHFILCDYQDLRRTIYDEIKQPDEELTEEQLHGKYVSPEDLRKSERFKKLLDEVDELREKDRDKLSQNMSPEQRKASEVAGRLALFDSISQNNPPIFHGIARRQHYPDPMLLVALDKVPGGAWFSPAELRDCVEELRAMEEDRNPHNLAPDRPKEKKEPTRWRQTMQDRLARMPQLYINPERRKVLEEFQSQVKAGTAQKSLDELAGILRQRSEKTVQEFEKAHKEGDSFTQLQVLGGIARQREDLRKRIAALVEEEKGGKVRIDDKAVSELKTILTERDADVIAELKRRLPPPGSKYHPDDQRFRMLHLNYLESRFPDLYPDSAAWQKFPVKEADEVLHSYDNLATAYQSGEPAQFDQASQDFFGVLRKVSEEVGPYPGEDSVGGRLEKLFAGANPGSPGTGLLDLEMQFDHVQPFRWAWVLMLGSLALFGASLALDSKLCYGLGFAAYFGSLGFQVFGFFTRIIIACRPPVSNMYETVVWVAFMSSIFALILELVYRRKVIALAGAMAATLGLVLADQLPLVLDPKISALEPVLRSNYWLTIHVLTIVSSYAGGTVAWALGNIALGLIAFGKPRGEVIRTLSQFTYKAMQIAVLLLAAGTFLGGWWAAESWGRFWGWDPKEVWALIALVCYVIPLHMRYIGWVKHFGLAVSAVVCYAAIVMSWYGVNFVLGAGLHSYGFGGGGPWWVFWAGLLNIEWVLVCCLMHAKAQLRGEPSKPERVPEEKLAAV
jgi:ABC-type transport system involved in cytochrome c biogenesis permease subunit